MSEEDKNTKRDIFEATTLIKAINNDCFITVKVLLYRGVNPNLCNKFYDYPIIEAVRKRNIRIVKLLLDQDVDLNVKDLIGNTALAWAEIFEHQEMIMLLKFNDRPIFDKNVLYRIALQINDVRTLSNFFYCNSITKEIARKATHTYSEDGFEYGKRFYECSCCEGFYSEENVYWCDSCYTYGCFMCYDSVRHC